MNLRLFIICITAVLALVGPALANSTATVHGAVYGWDTFEPLENAVVEVNSTPSQSMVAKYGLYSFDLVPGDYTIKASYYQSSTLIYSAEETLKIQDEGKYVLDLLLLPVYSKELMDGSEVNGFSGTPNESEENSSANNVNPVTDADTGQITSSETDNSSNTNSADQNWAGSLNLNYLSAALLLFLLLAASYRFSRKDRKREENQPQRQEHITEKEHTAGEPSEPFKVSGLSPKAPDRKVELSHKNVEKNLEFPDNLESEPDEGPQVKESLVKPSIASATEPITVSVKEPVIESLKETVKEPVGEPVKVSLKPASETTEKLLQGEPAEIKTDLQANGMELAGSELQEVSSEKVADNPSESPETEIPASRKKLPLPADLQEVMDIIRGQGGRITQKDLRSRLKYSEGKVSLMLADLERRELIEKFKRGRGNVVILKDEER